MPVMVTCDQCGKEFSKSPSKVLSHNLCSRACWYAFRPGRFGKPLSAETREKIRQANVGKHHSAETRQKMSRSHKGLFTREKHPQWKHTGAALHTGYTRSNRQYAARPCERCGVKPGDATIHRHHKDRNPLNNGQGNIQFLCIKHHREAHKEIEAHNGN